ncbi:hypothetical protein EC973_001241 [Apophysomyces ossiformis]|uniref:Uncharacterized protein n=1 Tax=Apophysomyces ossiformis TaxID=679940 RepID=A0A8H7BJY5_9FUNG|nr:hypothetical protein EC973_001241 [Apophysomyces ossiformis]
MSQVKTTTESQDSKLEERFNNRVLTRRVSRSTQSGSPVMTIREQLSQENAEEPGSSSSSEPSGQVTTRSQSIESSEATEPKKRRRKRVPGPTRKKTKPRGPEDTERETRKTTQRMSKEAREAKKAEREVIVKERLAELDELEKAVKEGSHPEYHKLTQGIEEKRSRREKTLKTRMKLVENNIKNAVEAQKKAAYDQFHISTPTINDAASAAED